MFIRNTTLKIDLKIPIFGIRNFLNYSSNTEYFRIDRIFANTEYSVFDIRYSVFDFRIFVASLVIII